MPIDMRPLRSGSHKGIGGGPKRTLKEMAEEFGVSPSRLAGLLRGYKGPACAVNNRSAADSAAWYAPKEMRAWWASLPEDVRKGNTKAKDTACTSKSTT